MENKVIESRVTADKVFNPHQDRRARQGLWGAVLVMLGLTLFASYGTRPVGPKLNTAFLWAVGLILVGTVGSAYFLAYRTGLQKVKLSLRFLLSDKDLVRRREGWPDVRIRRSELTRLYERSGWLVVESAEPRRRIAIPNDVEGFTNIRTELSKSSPIVKPPRVSPLAIVPSIVSLLLWTLVLLSREIRVVEVAGSLALSLQGWYSLRLTRLLHHSRKRFLFWAVLAFGWAAAVLVIYSRLARLR
jgi:hypothetical protein